jgi:hypothetical protein
MVAPIADRLLIFSVRISPFLFPSINAEMHWYLTDQGRTIQVSVQDLCPGCQGSNGIDFSEGVMTAPDSNYINDGVISVVWSFA